MNMYDDLFDSESEDSDDEIISKMAYPVTINNTVKWSHTQNVTPVPSQQNRSLHQTKVPSMIGRACTKLIIQNVDEGCKKRPRTAKDDASNSGETRKKKNIRTTRSGVAHTFSSKQTIQHSACNLTTTASGGVRTEVEFSTTTTTDITTADWSKVGSVLLKTASETSFEISSKSASTTTTNQDILETNATADLSALGSVLLKTTSENSFEVSINSACSCDNPSDNPSEV